MRGTSTTRQPQTATEVAVEVDSGEDVATEEDWRFAYPVCLREFMTTSSGLGESNEKPRGGENVGTGGVCFLDFLRCLSLLVLESSSENGDAVPSARFLSSFRLRRLASSGSTSREPKVDGDARLPSFGEPKIGGRMSIGSSSSGDCSWGGAASIWGRRSCAAFFALSASLDFFSGLSLPERGRGACPGDGKGAT